MRIEARHAELAFFSVLISASALAEDRYRLNDLGTRARVPVSQVINNSGQVTGSADLRRRGSHAFRWNGQKLRDLGTLGGRSSSAQAINDSGQVTGGSNTIEFSETHAFLWDAGIMRDLGTLGGTHSFGAAINNAGQVTGNSNLNGDQFQHAFLWDGTAMRDLGTLGGNSSGASDINRDGYVTGGSRTADGTSHAFLWDGTTMRDIHTLGNFHTGGNFINDAGQVAGQINANGVVRAFFWDRTAMQELGTLGGPTCVAQAMNANGQVTGFSSTFGNTGSHAFLWDAGLMQDLGTFGGSTSIGRAINGLGQVTGASFFAGDVGFSHAFLWDNGTLHDLNDLVDPADPLKPHVILTEGNAINDQGHVVASGVDLRVGRAKTFTLTPPSPDDLEASSGIASTGEAFVKLGWSDQFPDETEYRIERSPVTGSGASELCSAFTTIGSAKKDAIRFRDYNVSPNTNYCYQLRVFRSTFVRTLSNIARIRTP